MNPKVQYILMACLAVLVIGLSWYGINQKQKTDNLKHRLEDNPITQKKEKDQSLKPEDVSKYQKVVESKIDEFLDGEYSDDDIFQEGTAGRVFYGLFVPTGLKGLNEDSTKKDFKERYKDFSYDLSNVTAQKSNDGSVQVNANVEVKYKDKTIESGYDLISININSENELEGGTLYAKQ
ncbi:TPA: DUF6715 family protein [Staphylococcus aureus]|uniref:DUF6715 family protein n=1 Tax=Staphylococcus TaxID=1279 RepID=UPI0013F650E9|nr:MULTISPECIES: DUF6715 family protein [Staphylococcus]MCE4962628.1 hypothetical protein [Staphylococcus chromogenes]MDG6600759.1 hypothetical protein [Staphylococcus aureus]MDG6616941.1 hypothetical protein [Staphylococcus aureus]MDG6622264.1 hypothetical protein [Staphylococcus aureus]NHE44180.1 hypothetical protein [Staphylococcus aureus]